MNRDIQAFDDFQEIMAKWQRLLGRALEHRDIARAAQDEDIEREMTMKISIFRNFIKDLNEINGGGR